MAIATASSTPPVPRVAYTRMGSLAGSPTTAAICSAVGPQAVKICPRRPSSSHDWVAPGDPLRVGDWGARRPRGRRRSIVAACREIRSSAWWSTIRFTVRSNTIATTMAPEIDNSDGRNRSSPCVTQLVNSCRPLSISISTTRNAIATAVAATSCHTGRSCMPTSRAVSRCSRTDHHQPTPTASTASAPSTQ